MPDHAAELQTLAEKMTNTIYRAAKVCSYQSAYADKLLIYHGKDTFIHSAVYLSNVWSSFKISIFVWDDLLKYKIVDIVYTDF